MKSKTGKTNLTIVIVIIVTIILNVALIITFNRNDILESKEWSDYGNSVNESSYNDYKMSPISAINTAEKLITRNRISIETKNISKTVDTLEKLIESYKGKIVNKNIDLGDSRYGNITVKIPSEKGKEFVDRLNKDYTVSSYSTDVADVTEQYFNTEKEIQNLQRKIKLYEELANQTSIKEIDARIQIIDNIYYLENQIEYLKEQNANIDESIDYRDVEIIISAPDKIQGEKNYWHNTIQMVVLTIQGSFKVIIAAIALSVPFAILVGIPLIIYRKIKKK